MDEETLNASNPLAPEPDPKPDEQRQQAEQAAPDEGADDGDDADELEADDGDPKLAKAIKERAKWKSRARDAESRLTDATAQLEAVTAERDALRTTQTTHHREAVIAELAGYKISRDEAERLIDLATFRGFDLLAPTVEINVGGDAKEILETRDATAETRAKAIARICKVQLARATAIHSAFLPGEVGRAKAQPTSAI